MRVRTNVEGTRLSLWAAHILSPHPPALPPARTRLPAPASYRILCPHPPAPPSLARSPTPTQVLFCTRESSQNSTSTLSGNTRLAASRGLVGKEGRGEEGEGEGGLCEEQQRQERSQLECSPSFHTYSWNNNYHNLEGPLQARKHANPCLWYPPTTSVVARAPPHKHLPVVSHRQPPRATQQPRHSRRQRCRLGSILRTAPAARQGRSVEQRGDCHSHHEHCIERVVQRGQPRDHAGSGDAATGGTGRNIVLRLISPRLAAALGPSLPCTRAGSGGARSPGGGPPPPSMRC